MSDWDEYYEDDEDYMADVETTEDGITITINNSALRSIADTASARIAAHMSDEVQRLIEQRLDAIMDEAWVENLNTKAQEAIDSYLGRPRSKTNIYGEPTGGSVTLSEKIEPAVTSYLTERVDGKGQVLRDNYNRSNYPTRMEWIISTLVRDALDEETTKAANAVTDKARVVVAQHVSRFISEQMVPAIDVSQKPQ